MQITLKNIKSFIQGNFRFYLYKFISKPQHIKEQYAYRIETCKNDCIINNKCKYCGCPPMKKAFNDESCNNGKLFPDLMNNESWDKYKKENKIKINE